MNNRGFTLIELLAVIVVLAIILAIAVPRVISVIEQSRKDAFKISGDFLIKEAKKKTLVSFPPTPEDKIYTITNKAFVGDALDISGELPENGQIEIKEDGKSAIAIHNGKYCAHKTALAEEISVEEMTLGECMESVFGDVPSYDGFVVEKGVNKPEIVPGLSPVMWNGSSWVTTTESNSSWYDYTTKNWANAVSLDGSMWVWIPRFAYQIATNTHTSNFGTINVKLLMGNTNDTADGTIVGATPTYSGNSQTNYVTHPAFKFGNKEINGFWIAKFEATMGKNPNNMGSSCVNGNSGLDNVTTENIKIVPGISAWRCITIATAFLNSYEIRNKEAIYGFQSGKIDSHLTKITEWSATSYLSQSSIGRGTTNIWLNPNNSYTTGCAGTNPAESHSAVCNQYNVETRTSTTGNITGVYDMNGGSGELVTGHIDNITPALASNLKIKALMDADPKYRTILPVGTSDLPVENYNASQSLYGINVWETSNGTTNDLMVNSNTGWYLDYSKMPHTTSPWFVFGGHNRTYNAGGLYSFNRTDGSAVIDNSFRPTIIIN